MGLLKQCRDLLQLPVAVVTAEIDGGAHSHRSHVPGLIHRGEQDLLVHVGGREQLVVVELHQEGDPVSPAAGHRAQHAQG